MLPLFMMFRALFEEFVMTPTEIVLIAVLVKQNRRRRIEFQLHPSKNR